MKAKDPPEPSYAFRYRNPPRSGNEINGLGETECRRADHVFHDATGEPLAWKALDEFFSFINPWGVVRHMLVWCGARNAGTWTSIGACPTS
jgi:hypothetical protein